MTKPTVPNRRRAVVLRGYDHVRADVKTGADDAEDSLDAEANRASTLAGRVVDSKGPATLVATHAEHRDTVHEFTIGPEPNEVRSRSSRLPNDG